MDTKEKRFRLRAFAARWLGMRWMANKIRFGVTRLDTPYASARWLTGPDCRGWRIATADELRTFVEKFDPPASIPLLAYDSDERQGIVARGSDETVIHQDPLPVRHVCVLVVQETDFPQGSDKLIGLLDEKFPGDMDTYIPRDI